MNFYTFLLRGRMFKVFVIMKLTFLLVILLSFNVSASVFAQQITLNEKNAPLSTIFKKIETQSGYTFIYENDLLKQAKPVTVSIKNAALTSTLDRCLEGQPLTYSVVENTVIIKPKEKSRIQKVTNLFAPPIKVTGKVTDTTGAVLPGASIRIKGQNKTYLTDNSGGFSFSAQPGDEIAVSFIGYIPYTFKVTDDFPFKNIILHQMNSSLHEVIVSTGYQTLPKERATGSFVVLDSALINRRVGINILDRLEGVTSGLLFNSRILESENNAAITIRGRSTIFANPNPLIVVDNFPYDGDLNNINPNDIDNITVLKDAAAASIWGVRAGNGVIVITTKKGKRNSGPSISLTANVTVGKKPDLNYIPQISSSDFIGLEKYLFDQGYYDNDISTGYSAISPAVALMDRLKNGQITQSVYDSQISALKQHDVRKDLDKYFYRKSVSQQYNLNISGGGANNKYYISGGFDKTLDNKVTNSFDRYTITANNTYNLLKDKLEIFTGITFTRSNTASNPDAYTPYRPYEKLADESGNPLPVTGYQNLRASYIDTAGNGKLLDWHYYPLNERSSDRSARLISYRFLVGMTYKIIDHLRLQLNYQYQQDDKKDVIDRDINSFYTRNLINKFSSVDATGAVLRVIPIGDIVDRFNTDANSNYGRFQLNYENVIKAKHTITAIAGFEVKDYKDNYFGQRYYGYDPALATNTNGTINPMQYYPYYYDPYSAATIATDPNQLANTDRSRSWYANAAYTYDKRYTLSASARKDETNIFGVKANQKGVPLWSAGLGWNLSNETFYHIESLPYMKLRATYGYNGNADKTTSAYLTAYAFGDNYFQMPFSAITNPPNPSLGWEKIRNINLGLDFASRSNIVSGTIEYYQKYGTDLIGNSPIAPQTGVTTFKGNTADTKAHGLDITVNIRALERGKFTWNITALYSLNKDKVSKYSAPQPFNGAIVSSNYANPLAGYPYYAVFAFKYAGLNAQGDPQGYLNGQVSTDYGGIYNSTDPSELAYKGSGTPTSFGSLRNTFSYDRWNLSANITYKLGYFFRRSGVFNGTDYFNYMQGDYEKRWQKPGDEQQTTVPALVYPVNDDYRGIIYTLSENLIEKGDHIRLQDIRLAYSFGRSGNGKSPFKSLQVYTYVNNVGILWRANKKGIDPDAGTQILPSVRTFSIGFNTNF